MPLHKIVSRWNSAKVLFECEVTDSDASSGLATRVALEQANLSGASLSGANLSGASLSGANLSDAYLSGANLIGAYLSGANLSGANLSGAYLSGANLSCANLIVAYLSGANLSGAYLSGANLSGANLSGAYLSDANLSGAKWNGIIINRAPLQITIPNQWPIFILDDHMQIGCELHTLADWRQFDNARIVAMDGRSALAFWRKYKDVLLAMATADGRGITPEAA